MNRPNTSLSLLGIGLGLSLSGCTVDVLLGSGDEIGDETDLGSGESDEASTDEASTDEASTDEASTDETSTDEGMPAPTPNPACQVVPGELDGLLPCELPPAALSLDPVVQWTWAGEGNEDSIVTTPLVANLDDDNGDGFVDLCDVPDVVAAVVDLPATKTAPWPKAHLAVIDGASGQTTQVFEHGIDGAVNPAIADLDRDGVPEIIALEPYGINSPYMISDRRLVAFSASGELLWQGDHWQASRGGGAIAIADLDADGFPEILAPEYVADAHGQLLWAPSDPALAYSMPIAVDLDLDGTLEVLFGGSAYDHDGTWLFDSPTVPTNRGSASVANFDGDEYPELYVQHDGVHGILEHDGSLKAQCPSEIFLNADAGNPTAITDLNGDGEAEILFALQDKVFALKVQAGVCSVAWSKTIDSSDALASATAFDLLGDGEAEVVYADRSETRIYDHEGTLMFSLPRTARESISNPIIADVDGDGGADMLVTSSQPISGVGQPELPSAEALVMIGNSLGAFAPTRRIWNQHGYRRNNIREDGRVPTYMAPDWSEDNSFRANSPSLGFEQCIPPGLSG